jgi:hypothetical protein
METDDLTLPGVMSLIEGEVLSWPGVGTEPGRFASTAFKLGRREIGHVHRNGVADFGFPKALRDELIATGRAEPHQAGIHGGVSYRIRERNDVEPVLALFRLSYDRLRATETRDSAGTTPSADQIGA